MKSELQKKLVMAMVGAVVATLVVEYLKKAV